MILNQMLIMGKNHIPADIQDPLRHYHPYLILILVCVVAIVNIYLLWRQKQKTQQYVDYYSKRDNVTGCANYEGFLEQASKMLKYKDVHYAIGYIDICNFKAINDFYGRSQGNEILNVVADRINDLVMPDGAFARRFADRFVFIVGFIDVENVEYIVKTYLSEIEVKIKDIDESITINCNCGIYEVEDNREPIDEMVDKAAIATKLSKKSISTTTVIYDKALNENILRNQEITCKMKKAYKNNEFVVYIQPKVSLRDGRIVGGEALVRWKSIAEGMIPPDLFIPSFEQNGFVTKIDFYVLELICNMIAERKNANKKNVVISVNQSRLHVYDSRYINKLINVFNSTGVEKEYIMFEITESAFTENTNDMVELTHRMSKLGYKISMDDFGCGYSSLNMLNMLPISELKLDKKFLEDESERSQYIIKSIVNLAHGIGISTVCEGIENEKQMKFLRSIGCDIAQGYYYGKPVPMDEFEKMLDEYKA